jgi:tRNA (cmo5U34)-methyltransferase
MSKSPDPTRDELFAEVLTQPELFTFSESVAGVFPDMINRSVPGYATVVAMTGVLAAQHARPDSTIYDLGCSWGASLLSAARKIDYPSCQLIGIDNSEAMLKRARLNFQEQLSDQRVVLQASDIMDIQLENASVGYFELHLAVRPDQASRDPPQAYSQRHAARRCFDFI